MGKMKVRFGLLGILVGLTFSLISAGTATAGTLDQLLPVLPSLAPVTSTVNSLGLPIQLGSSSSGLPIIPAIDPNALINQTTSDINALQLPLQLPQVNLGLPTLPAIDPTQIVGTTVDQLNSAVPLPVAVPNPIDLLTQPITGLPGLPGAGGTGTPPVINPLSLTSSFFAPTGTSGINGFATANQGGFLPSFITSRTFGASGGRSGNSNMNLSPAGASEDAGILNPLSTGLAMLPLLGAMCIFLALGAYFKSAQHVWHART